MSNSSMHIIGRKLTVRDLVINWHITEACNYRCRYCYAHWNGSGRELVHDRTRSEDLLYNLIEFFSKNRSENPLSKALTWEGVRLNIAGGEPLLYADRVNAVLQSARQLGFSTSLISNGSLLSTNLAKEMAPNLSLIGISVDSPNALTNRLIGRSDSRGNLIAPIELERSLQAAKMVNPYIGLKINTVINSRNVTEDFSSVITQFSPDRWKVLRMLPVLTTDLSISATEFREFLGRHRRFQDVMVSEDNVDMSNSYFMIDPHGRFFQNASSNRGYSYSRPILSVGVAAALSDIITSPAKFARRYQGDDDGGSSV